MSGLRRDARSLWHFHGQFIHCVQRNWHKYVLASEAAAVVQVTTELAQQLHHPIVPHIRLVGLATLRDLVHVLGVAVRDPSGLIPCAQLRLFHPPHPSTHAQPARPSVITRPRNWVIGLDHTPLLHRSRTTPTLPSRAA